MCCKSALPPKPHVPWPDALRHCSCRLLPNSTARRNSWDNSMRGFEGLAVKIGGIAPAATAPKDPCKEEPDAGKPDSGKPDSGGSDSGGSDSGGSDAGASDASSD